MLALVFNRSRLVFAAVTLTTLVSFASCATEKKPQPLVSDPNAKPESTLPWNKQEKWEASQGFPDYFNEGR
jgi:hypothetical protein